MSQVAHQVGTYPCSCSMTLKRLGEFLLPPGSGDARPSQGYPRTLNSPVPIYIPEWIEALLSVLPLLFSARAPTQTARNRKEIQKSNNRLFT